MPVIIPGPNSDVLPAIDLDYDIWGTNLGVWMIANPAIVTAPTPAAVAALAASYNAALMLATDPATRTTPSVADKNNERVLSAPSYRDVVRQLVAQYRSGVITGMQLNDAGVRVPDLIPTVIPAPGTVPLLSVISATSGSLQMRASDSATPDSRAKPYGYVGLEIVRIVTPTPPANGDGGVSVGLFTRQPMFVASPPANIGLMCHYFARWYNARGLFGGWSLVASFVGT